jgi:beta-galactosidase
MMKLRWIFFLALCQAIVSTNGQSVRERINMDFDWRFALGHAYDPVKDFNNGTGYFSYYTKAGYGDGPADFYFEDRTWRLIDLPHDWNMELPFDSTGSHSHGQ